MEDSLGTMVNALPLDVAAPFESTEGDKDHVYQTLFRDQHKSEGVFNHPSSNLRMNVKKPKPHGRSFVSSPNRSIINPMMRGKEVHGYCRECYQVSE